MESAPDETHTGGIVSSLLACALITAGTAASLFSTLRPDIPARARAAILACGVVALVVAWQSFPDAPADAGIFVTVDALTADVARLCSLAAGVVLGWRLRDF